MTPRSIGTWSALLLVPLLPVVVLYWLFADLNYFQLEDTGRGVVATGPVALYVALVVVGRNVYLRLVELPTVDDETLRNVTGRWDFEATSFHGTKLHGDAVIEAEKGRLQLRGSLCDARGVQVGTWASTMAQLEAGRLSFVYTLQETREGHQTVSTALCTVSVGEDPDDPMEGTWVVAGRDEATGEVTYVRPR